VSGRPYGQGLVFGPHSAAHELVGSYAVPCFMQYPPAWFALEPVLETSCWQSNPVSHVQYVAPSSVRPFGFAQRHEQ